MAAPEERRQLGHLRVGPEEVAARASSATRCLRGGIEVQVLDHGYTEQYEKQSGKKANWFTTNGDVFPGGIIEDDAFRSHIARRSPQLSLQAS